MKSLVETHSIVIAGRKTSVSLEEAFWSGLKEIAGARAQTLSAVVNQIYKDHRPTNLSSAIRLFVLEHYRLQVPGQKEVGPALKLARAS